MLEISNVVKTFGKDVTAVDGVSLELKAGVVGLIGHKRRRQTTLMQMIAPLDPADRRRHPVRCFCFGCTWR